MKIQIRDGATCGNVQIPAGEYWVALNPELAEVNLAARGKDIKIKAVRRKAKTNRKTLSIQFYSGGGLLWSLVISTPKHGEWIATIEYKTPAPMAPTRLPEGDNQPP